MKTKADAIGAVSTGGGQGQLVPIPVAVAQANAVLAKNGGAVRHPIVGRILANLGPSPTLASVVNAIQALYGQKPVDWQLAQQVAPVLGQSVPHHHHVVPPKQFGDKIHKGGFSYEEAERTAERTTNKGHYAYDEQAEHSETARGSTGRHKAAIPGRMKAGATRARA
jgi:hypothetical protein